MLDRFIGKTCANIQVSKSKDEIVFTFNNGETYRMYHEQDCCEHVYIKDINGDLADIMNSPILYADETSNSTENIDICESSTWTFYRIGTIKGTVVISWLGESNGYYSESVEVVRIN